MAASDLERRSLFMSSPPKSRRSKKGSRPNGTENRGLGQRPSDTGRQDPANLPAKLPSLLTASRQRVVQTRYSTRRFGLIDRTRDVEFHRLARSRLPARLRAREPAGECRWARRFERGLRPRNPGSWPHEKPLGGVGGSDRAPPDIQW